MTVTDPDVLTVARSLHQRYRDQAKWHALARAAELLYDHDPDGRALWMLVAEAIDELWRREHAGTDQ